MNKKVEIKPSRS